MTEATAFPQLVEAVLAIPDQDAAAIQVTPDQDALAEEANLDLVDLVCRPVIPDLDVRRSDDRSQDLLAVVAQTLDQPGGLVRLVARFPVEAELAVLLILGVLGVLDLDVRLQVFRIQGLSDVQDEGAPGRDVQAAKVNHDQDDRARDQRLEERCNTRFRFL